MLRLHVIRDVISPSRTRKKGESAERAGRGDVMREENARERERERERRTREREREGRGGFSSSRWERERDPLFSFSLFSLINFS